MYMNKNKAFSLVEIIIAISLTLIVGSICFITFYSMNKSFLVMNKTYKRDKEIASFRDLLVSHIKWNEGVEIRISNVSKNQNINSLGNLFLKESEKEGNLLVLKIQAYNETGKTTSRYYRCFLFYEDKVSISYFDEGDVVNLFNGTVILENCSGKFNFDNNILKFYLKDKEKEYEEILYYDQK